MTIFEQLARLITVPKPLIFEIGCNDGTDTNRMLELFPRAIIHGFEPDERARARNTAMATLWPFAIGDKDGTVKFYPSKGRPHETYHREWDFSGSIRRPTGHRDLYPWCTFAEPVKVPVMRLDTWARHIPGSVDLIWADVQGAEVDLIAGARDTLLRTRFVYTEYNDRELYEGQKPLTELLALLPSFEVVERYDDDVLLRNTRV